MLFDRSPAGTRVSTDVSLAPFHFLYLSACITATATSSWLYSWSRAHFLRSPRVVRPLLRWMNIVLLIRVLLKEHIQNEHRSLSKTSEMVENRRRTELQRVSESLLEIRRRPGPALLPSLRVFRQCLTVTSSPTFDRSSGNNQGVYGLQVYVQMVIAASYDCFNEYF